jgi:uncharacterized protein (TIGR03086 family)
MSTQELFILSNQTLQSTVSKIKDEQMELIIPGDLSWMENFTVRKTLNVYAYENFCVSEVLAGKKDLANNAEFKEDFLKDDPQGNFKRYTDQANESVRNVHDLEKIVHISYGDFPVDDYLRDITIQRSFAAYDLAKFIGADTTLPEDLVKGLWEITQPVADMLRAYGVFKEKIEVPEDAPLQQRLLGLTGRDPL